MKIKKYSCPQCGGHTVVTEFHQMWLVNTGELYCNSMETGDDDSPAKCLTDSCDWFGSRIDLVEEDI